MSDQRYGQSGDSRDRELNDNSYRDAELGRETRVIPGDLIPDADGQDDKVHEHVERAEPCWSSATVLSRPLPARSSYDGGTRPRRSNRMRLRAARGGRNRNICGPGIGSASGGDARWSPLGLLASC